jgi:hypothetical protein
MVDALLLGLALVLFLALVIPRLNATIEQLFEDLW